LLDDPAQRRGALLEHAEIGRVYASADTVDLDEVIEPDGLRDALLAALQLTSARRRGLVGPATHHSVVR
jgi:hypothetical protein